MSDGPYEIRYEVTDAQVRQAAESFWWRRHGPKGFVISGLFLAFALMLTFAHDSPVTQTVFYTLAVHQLVLTFVSYRQFVRATADIRAKLGSKVATVIFSDDGVSMRAEFYAVSYKWRVCTGLWCCRDVLVLRIAGGGFHAIPRAAVSQEVSDYVGRCLRASRPRQLICSKCGYDLRGQTVPRCPECGTPFDADNLKVKR